MILFLVTHFNDGDRVAAFIDHVRTLDPDGTATAIAVADNSADEPFACAPSPNLAVYRASENLGYLNGCAFARTAWLAEGRSRPEIIAVCNTDVWLDPTFLRGVAVLELAEVGVVAPDVRLPNGSPQNPFMVHRPSRGRLSMYRLIFGSRVLTVLMQSLERVKLAQRKASGHASSVRDIYAAHGSIFLLTNTFFSRGGTLEFDGFMYAEEIHIAEQARTHGLRTVMAPALRVTHERRVTTTGIASRRRREWARERLDAVLREYY